MPCTRYKIKPGSPRILSNTVNAENLSLVLQVPTKTGHFAVPNVISIWNIPVTQLSVNYLNPDKSPIRISNDVALKFVSSHNGSNIVILPEHLPAQMLQVNIDGNASSSSSFEIHMIVCYEPIELPQVNLAYLNYCIHIRYRLFDKEFL